MTNEIVENSNSQNVPAQFSMQNLQEFYQKIVGRQKSLNGRYTESYQYEIEDIESLHQKITYIASTYGGLVNSSHNFTITDINEDALSVPSMEEFKLLVSSRNMGTQAIELEYNFLIKHSQTEALNNYKISVDLISGIAVFEDIQKNMPRGLWHGIGYLTGRYDVEFVDYGIGQNFVGVIRSWFDTVKIIHSTKLFDLIQKNSQWLPIILKIVFLLLGVAFSVTETIKFLNQSDSNKLLAQYLILSFALLTFFSELGFRMGKAIEKSINKIWKLAYIKLNSGDAKLLQKVEAHNKDCFIAILWRFLGVLFMAVISSCIAEAIIKYVPEFLK